ncbi:hypothetical protein MBLNU457_7831t1 [Dothideomycetes sp. NU457]
MSSALLTGLAASRRRRSDRRSAAAEPLYALRRDGRDSQPVVVEQNSGDFISDDVPKRSRRASKACAPDAQMLLLLNDASIPQDGPPPPAAVIHDRQTQAANDKTGADNRCSDKAPADAKPRVASSQHKVTINHTGRIVTALFAPLPEVARGPLGSAALVLLTHLAIYTFWIQWDIWMTARIDDIETLLRHKGLWWQIHDWMKFFPLLLAVWLYMALLRTLQ